MEEEDYDDESGSHAARKQPDGEDGKVAQEVVDELDPDARTVVRSTAREEVPNPNLAVQAERTTPYRTMEDAAETPRGDTAASQGDGGAATSVPAQAEDGPSRGWVTLNGRRGGVGGAPLVALRVFGRPLRTGTLGIGRGGVVG